MRITTNMIYQRGVEWSNKHYSKLAKAQEQISSGKRILKPSDDPTASSRLMELHKQLQLNAQYGRNMTLAYGRQGIQETAIVQSNEILQQARESAIRGNNAALSGENRQTIALEVRQLRQQLIDAANAKDSEGAYLFAGYKEQSLPFTTAASGDVVYNGDQGQRHIQIGPARQVAVGDSGDSVFMRIPNGNGQFRSDLVTSNKGNGTISVGSVTNPVEFQNFTGGKHPYSIEFTVTPDPIHAVNPNAPPEPIRTFSIKDADGTALLANQSYSDGAAIQFHGLEVKIEGKPEDGDRFIVKPAENQSIFKTLDNLISALETPGRNPSDIAQLSQGLDNALADIDQGLLSINQTRGLVGSRMKALDTQDQVNQDLDLQLQSLRSELGSADIMEVASNMSQELLALQASQQSFMKIQGLSLFNYLK